MRVLTRACFGVGVLLCASCLAQSEKEKKAEITGQVVNSANGQPIPGAIVVATIYSPPRSAQPEPVREAVRRVLTDDTGRFTISGLPEGYGVVRAGRRGFQARTGGDAAQEQIMPGQSRTLTLKLVPLGVVHGRVVNQDGEPVPGLTVALVKIVLLDGSRRLQEHASKTTDDLGEYRLWHLSPGNYFLKIAGRRAAYTTLADTGQLPDSSDTYPPLYYPSASDAESSETLRLQPGQTMRADFTVSAQPAYRIRGTLRGFPRGIRPTLRLLRGDDPVGNRTLVNPTSGSFEVFDVTPGTYTLQAYTSTPSLLGETPVSVEKQDVSGLSVAVMTETEVRGSVQFTGVPGTVGGRENMVPPQRLAFVQARNAERRDIPARNTSETARLQGDGSFILKLLPGRYEISVAAPGWYLATMQSGTSDVLGEGLLVDSSPPEEVRVHMVGGGGRMEGQVTDLASGEFATIILARRYGSRMIPSVVRTTADGRFTAVNLAPGDYTLVAVKSEEDFEYRDPGIFAAAAKRAVSVHLRDGGQEQVRLKTSDGDKP